MKGDQDKLHTYHRVYVLARVGKEREGGGRREGGRREGGRGGRRGGGRGGAGRRRWSAR